MLHDEHGESRATAFQELLSRVSSRLVAARAGDIDEVVPRCLGDIASHFAATCVLLGTYTEEWAWAEGSRGWMDPALAGSCGPIPHHLTVPEIGAALTADGLVVLDTTAPSPALCNDARTLAEARVRSHLVAVLNTPGPAVDAIALSCHHYVQQWDEQTADRLRLLGEVLMGAVSRFEAERVAAMEQKRYLLLTDHMPGLYSVINPDHTYRYVNLAYAEQFGRPREEIIGKHMRDVVGPLYGRVSPAIDRALAGEPQAIEVDLPKAPGGPRYLVGHLVPSRDPDGTVDGVLALITNVTDLRAAQRRLQVSQEELQLDHRVVRAFLSDDDAVAYADALDAILEALESPVGLFGFIDLDGSLTIPSLAGRVWDQCQVQDRTTSFPPSIWGGLWGQALQERRTIYANSGLSAPPGHLPITSALFAPIHDAGVLLGLLGVANRQGGYGAAEIARLDRVAGAVAPVIKGRQARAAAEVERSALERKLVQVQKMEAVGRLAGGVAHDFNNILQAIVGYGALMLSALPRDHELRPDLDEILLAAERAKALVRQLLLFSRPGAAQFVSTNLGAMLLGLVRMLRRIIGEDIELIVDVGASDLTARVDVGQIEQVVMNLAVNARDAMPEGGRLTIELTEAVLDAVTLQSRPWALPGRFARVSIIDTGTGISDEAAERMFEPFFTTKEIGKGTGLGLATVYGILKDHGGIIVAANEPRGGARFDVYLPQAEQTTESEIAIPTHDVGPTGNETVLLAEDDPQVRRFAVSVLRAAGYRVLQASDGATATSMFLQFHNHIDLVVLDVIMPGSSGVTVHDEILALKPDLPVLFASGYDQDLLADRLSAPQREGLLHKPFSPRELLQRVRELLDRRTIS